MGFFVTMREFILKLQSLPDSKKKIILIVVVVISALIIGFFEIIWTINNFSKIGNPLKSINVPTIDLQK